MINQNDDEVSLLDLLMFPFNMIIVFIIWIAYQTIVRPIGYLVTWIVVFLRVVKRFANRPAILRFNENRLDKKAVKRFRAAGLIDLANRIEEARKNKKIWR